MNNTSYGSIISVLVILSILSLPFLLSWLCSLSLSLSLSQYLVVYPSVTPDVYLHLGNISYLSYTFTYVSSQSIPGYIYLLVIHTYHLHSITRVFVLYVSHIIHAPLSTNGKGKQPSRYHVLPSYIHSIFYNHHSSTPTFYEFYPC